MSSDSPEELDLLKLGAGESEPSQTETTDADVFDWDEVFATAEADNQAKLEGREPPTKSNGGWFPDAESIKVFAVFAVLGTFVVSLLAGSFGFWLWVALSDSASAEGARAWLGTFWPLLAIFVLQSGLYRAVSKAFRQLQKNLDYKYPDNMDVHSGHWLENRLKELGMEHHVEVSGIAEEFFRTRDAYDPRRDIVFLSDVTYHKNDPTFWAIAAHELGHALVHRNQRIWSLVTQRARFFFHQAVVYLPMLILGNSFYGSEAGNALILVVLLIGILAGALVVADEAWASNHALRLLDDDDRIHAATLKDIALLLGGALSTYAAPLLVFGILLLFWGPLSDLLLSAEFSVGPALEGNAQTLTTALSVVLVAFIGHTAWQSLRAKTEEKNPEDESLLFFILYPTLAIGAQIAFFGLTWNLDDSVLCAVAGVLFSARFLIIPTYLLAPLSILTALIVDRVISSVIGVAPKEWSDMSETKAPSMPRSKILGPEQLTKWSRATANWAWILPVPLMVMWWMSLV